MALPIIAGVAGGIALRQLVRKGLPVLAKGAKKLLSSAKPKSVKGAVGLAVGVPTAVGVLSSSPTTRSAVKNVFNPVENLRRGKNIAQVIEDPKKAQDVLGIGEQKTTKEKITGALKAGGVAGAVVGAGILAKKALEAKRARDALQNKPTLGTTKEALPPNVLGSSLQPATVEQISPPRASMGQIPATKSRQMPLTIVQIDL